jgi:hypothetical protein
MIQKDLKFKLMSNFDNYSSLEHITERIKPTVKLDQLLKNNEIQKEGTYQAGLVINKLASVSLNMKKAPYYHHTLDEHIMVISKSIGDLN